jgi:hypothetical protein
VYAQKIPKIKLKNYCHLLHSAELLLMCYVLLCMLSIYIYTVYIFFDT